MTPSVTIAPSDIRRRLTTAAVFLPLYVLAIVWGHAPFLLAVMALTVLGSWEFYRMAARKPAQPRPLSGTGLALAFPALLYWSPEPGLAFPALLMAATVGIGLAQLLDPRGEEAIGAVAVTILGAVYVGLLLGHQVLVREFAREIPGAPYGIGAALLAIPVILTWLNDTTAYFVGKRWGRRKLLPRVSPRKTVEGALGAGLASVVGALPLCWAVNRWVPLFDLGDALTIGILIGIAAPCGDLVESAFKRDAGVKDTSDLVPGHGGILDRFDSLLVTVPVFYYWLHGMLR